jgi:hypothetical protein
MNFDLNEIKYKIEEKRLIFGKKFEDFLLKIAKSFARKLTKIPFFSTIVIEVNWRKDGFFAIAVLVVSQADPLTFLQIFFPICLLWAIYLTIKKCNLFRRNEKYFSRFMVFLIFSAISLVISLSIKNLFGINQVSYEKKIEFFLQDSNQR